MDRDTIKHRLAAILSADVVGYNRYQRKPDWPLAHRYLAASYAQLGRLDEAREAL